MREELITEAINRMTLLDLSSVCIEAFKQGNVWLSEGLGALYELNDKEQSIITEFENNNKDCIVYHMIHNIFEFGECYSLLYVSSDKKEWQQDKEDIKNGYAFVYVKNIDNDWCSEFGTIAIKPQFGGLVRLS